MPKPPSTETGEVLDLLPDQRAKVKIPKRSTCQGCGHRSFCDPFGSEHMAVDAINTVGAKPGQQVEITFQSETQVKAIAILYLIPLLALLLGAFIGHNLNLFGNQDASAAVFSLAAVAAAFAGIRWVTKRQGSLDSTQHPRITRILS